MIKCREPGCNERATLWVAVEYDNGTSDVSAACENHPFDVGMHIIKQHEEDIGEHTSTIGWEPMITLNLESEVHSGF